MIRRVVIERFKRFEKIEFDLPGHVVLAGPNNTGKTTVLQAIAAWGLAVDRFRSKNDFHRHGGSYSKVPITRQVFSAVPLRSFDLLWRDRAYEGSIAITIKSDKWMLPMELIKDSTEQIYVRPWASVDPLEVQAARLNTVFVPPMTGLSVDEPLYQKPKVDHVLGQAKPGEILRNLLVEASATQAVWAALLKSIRQLFNVELLPPNTDGPHIIAEYQQGGGAKPLDIASAGSGFQQVLMLLTFLHTRPASVLLVDEPDAHLHVILQDAIYGELRAVAAEKKSQLVLATHSEVIINSVEPSELCVMLDKPRFLATNDERRKLIASLGVLSHEDIMLALDAPGILYLEDYTDLQVLREWARALDHSVRELLTTRLFWKRTVMQPRPGAEGIRAREHYEALRLVNADLPGLELLDGDALAEITPTEITGTGLQRARWRRYEIESYLLHPAALDRFVEAQVGTGDAPKAKEAWRAALHGLLGGAAPDFLAQPLEPPAVVDTYLRTTKARTEILPPLLSAAGLPGFPYTRYHEIAAAMAPEDIHPEVKEKLDAIVKAFRQ